MTVAVPTTVVPNPYSIGITATANGVNRYGSASLLVGATSPASIIGPVPGPIPGGSTTFTWNAGVGANQYILSVGSSQGASDIYSGAVTTAQSATVTVSTGLPAVYVALASNTIYGWRSQSYLYTTSSGSIINLPVVSVYKNSREVQVTASLSSGDGITGCSAPAGVITRLVPGAQNTIGITATIAATAGASQISCSTSAEETLYEPIDVFGGPTISGVSLQANSDGTATLQIYGSYFGDDWGFVSLTGPGYPSAQVVDWEGTEDGGYDTITATVTGLATGCNEYDLAVFAPDPYLNGSEGSAYEELCFEAAPVYTISGRVTVGANGPGLSGVSITVAPVGGFAIPITQTDQTGYYSVPVSAGSYSVSAGLTAPVSLYWISNTPQPANAPGSVTVNFTANPKTTVFLVPGIGNANTDMQPLASQLAATDGSGLDPKRFLVDTVGFSYARCAQGGPSCNSGVLPSSPNYCSVANGGVSLAQYIASWKPPGFVNQVGPPGGIVLAGYSMGGLMARDAISKNELPAPPVGLVTLGTPSLGYPFLDSTHLPVNHTSVQCPQLVADMGGSWFTGTNNPAPASSYIPSSSFLATLNQNWSSASYGNYWMAAAGQACTSPTRTLNSAIGCPVSATTSDCVVCYDSAAYQGTVSGQAPGQAPSTPWVDNGGTNGSAQYVHTLTGDGFGTFLVLGAAPAGSLEIYQPTKFSSLFQTIVGVINAH
jgi:hypothetical protein